MGRTDYDDLFDREGKWIDVYVGIERTDDPFEKNVTVELLPPIPIKAIICDLTTTQAHWKMPNVQSNSTKLLLIPIRYKTLIQQSQQIGLRDKNNVSTYYEGWKVSGKMQYREVGEILELYIVSKTA